MVSLARTVTVDTGSAGAPSTPDLVASSDFGLSSVDDITNDATPTLTGTAEAGATVTIREGATVLATTVAAGSGNWVVTTAALGDGVHNLTVTATDAAGNESAASGGLSLTIDTVHPARRRRRPTCGRLRPGRVSSDDLTNDPTPTFSGTAAAGATVLFKEGATVLGTAIADGNGDWTITSPVLGDGTHSITATAIDVAGNESPASAGLAVTIDTAAPAAPTIIGFVDDSGTTGDGRTIDTTSISPERRRPAARSRSSTEPPRSARRLRTAWCLELRHRGADARGAFLHRRDRGSRRQCQHLAGTGGDRRDPPGLRPDVPRPELRLRHPGRCRGGRAGRSVSSAGDLNGDGFADVIVGAIRGDDGGAVPARPTWCSARPPVRHADLTGRSVIDLSNVASSFTAAQGFVIQGDAAGDDAGWSVSVGGGCQWRRFRRPDRRGAIGDDGGPDAGEAYVVFGTASGFGTAVGPAAGDRPDQPHCRAGLHHPGR